MWAKIRQRAEHIAFTTSQFWHRLGGLPTQHTTVSAKTFHALMERLLGISAHGISSTLVYFFILGALLLLLTPGIIARR